MGSMTTNFDIREDLSLTIEEFDHDNNESGYVAHRLFPATPVPEKSGKFPNIPLEEEMRDIDPRRNQDGTFNVSSMEISDDNYTTQSYGLEAQLDSERVKAYASIWDAEYYENRRLQRAIRRWFEIQVATFATTIASYAVSRTKGGLTALNEANVAAGSIKPIDIIDEQREPFADDAGVEPNALFITRRDMRLFLKCPQILDRITGQSFQDAQAGKMVNPQVLADALDIEHVVVSNARKNTGKTRNLSRLWANGRAVLAYIRPNGGDPGTPCFGETMVWSKRGALDGSQIASYGVTYELPQVDGWRVRQQANWGRKVRNEEMARLLLLDGTAQPT
jgi:hypothetical protein